METAPRVAEGQDEDVENDGPAPEVDPGLAPVDLALLAGRGLEAHRGPLRRLLGGAQGANEALHRLVAAAIAVCLAQLLEQNARGVLDLRRAGVQKPRVLAEQRVGAPGACVRLPRRLVENPAHRFAIQLQLPGDLGLRSPLAVEQPVHFPPAVLADHASLPEWCDLGASVGGARRRSVQQCLAHVRALLAQEGWGIFDDHRWGLLGDR